jgi:hypothetical protein
MLFLLALRSDATRTAVMTLAPTADILPSSTQVRDGSKADLKPQMTDFRFTPRNGHHLAQPSRPLSADIVAKVPKGAAANFPPKNETSDNRRSIGLQTRCQNRL